MTPGANVDVLETGKFGRLAATWWDPKGPMHSLHAINPLRMAYIAQSLDLTGRRVVDVGCGGGLLAESLAKASAKVTGIDLSEELIELARRHAASQRIDVDYRLISIEQLAAEQPGDFDVVTCMEVLEHIPAPATAVAACAQALRVNGHAFFATLDRSIWSLLFAIMIGEYVVGLLPRGSHTFRNLIQPDELKAWAGASGLHFAGEAGIAYNPLTGRFRRVDHHEMSYMMHFIKR
jgi:2-polyprenyl-6-hydroxyphenyl methylase/3-demethylubiquinone-9 3-methyltransferase